MQHSVEELTKEQLEELRDRNVRTLCAVKRDEAREQRALALAQLAFDRCPAAATASHFAYLTRVRNAAQARLVDVQAILSRIRLRLREIVLQLRQLEPRTA